MDKRAFFKGPGRWLVALAAGLVGVAVLLAGLFGLTGLASAAQSTSSAVALIGSADNVNGAPLITSGGEFNAYTFTDLAPANVDSETLADYDTVVLNVASPEMDCDTGSLTTDAKTALVDFVAGGGKLIIYDTECASADYSWLPFPFTTNNPGGIGAGGGTLSIVECTTLACSDPQSHYYVDAVNLASQTDAVGDMNVMVTRDSHWCLNAQGTNGSDVTGAVHAYAHSGSGLIIYNGLDIDYMGYEPQPPDPNGLTKIWLQELQQPFDPDGLPCGTKVVTPVAVHKRSTRTPTPAPTDTPAPPTATHLPPTLQPPPTATASGGAGPLIVMPNTGEGAETGAGLPWTPIACLLAVAAATLAAGGWYARRRWLR